MSSIDPRPITAAGQDAALALMTDTCTVVDVGEVVTSDDGTDTSTSVTVYEGPCRVKPLVSRTEGDKTQGPALTAGFQYTVSLPMSATAVAFGQRLTVTDSLDPSLPGIAMRIDSVERGSQVTARRLRCMEVSR